LLIILKDQAQLLHQISHSLQKNDFFRSFFIIMSWFTVKTSKEKLSKKTCRKRNVEFVLAEKKNVDHIKCRKFQNLIMKQYWFTFLWIIH
jgi:hypothetical protein